MNYKESTKKELEFLKNLGYTQAQIAEKIGYRVTGITEAQSKGGSEKLYKAILLFKELEILKKATYIEVGDGLNGETVNSGQRDQFLLSALSSVAEVQHLLAEQIEQISASIHAGNLSTLGTSTTNLEAVSASFLKHTSDERGKKGTGRANRKKP